MYLYILLLLFSPWRPIPYKLATNTIIIKTGDYDVVKLLVDAGADVKATNKLGQTPLYYTFLKQSVKHGDTVYLTPDDKQIHKFDNNGLRIK